jgi:hypothetical protein
MMMSDIEEIKKSPKKDKAENKLEMLEQHYDLSQQSLDDPIQLLALHSRQY